VTSVDCQGGEFGCPSSRLHLKRLRKAQERHLCDACRLPVCWPVSVVGPSRGLKTRLTTPLNRRKQQGTMAGFGFWLLGGHIALGHVNGVPHTCANAMTTHRPAPYLSSLSCLLLLLQPMQLSCHRPCPLCSTHESLRPRLCTTSHCWIPPPPHTRIDTQHTRAQRCAVRSLCRTVGVLAAQTAKRCLFVDRNLYPNREMRSSVPAHSSSLLSAQIQSIWRRRFPSKSLWF
jgi:hypothetical protein